MGDEPPVQPLSYYGPTVPADGRSPIVPPFVPETPEEKRWRYRRVVYRVGLGLLLGVIA